MPRKGKRSIRRTEKAKEFDAQQAKKRKHKIKGHPPLGSGSDSENGQGKAGSDEEVRSSDGEGGGGSGADGCNKSGRGEVGAESPIKVGGDGAVIQLRSVYTWDADKCLHT